VATNAWKIQTALVGTNATTGFSGFNNGAADAGPGTVGTAVAASTDVLIGARRNASNADAAFLLTGDIAEIILYDLLLSTPHRVIIENYLAAKYNITGLGTEAYTDDGSGYDYDVAGIGQAGGVSYKDAKGPGRVRIWNPSGMADGEYLMWGHDNGSMASTTSGVDGAIIRDRITRIWALTEVGDVGTVNIAFDLTGTSGFVGSNLRLLIDRDNDGFQDNDVTPIAGVYSQNGIVFTAGLR
jgi:hypothetical protein